MGEKETSIYDRVAEALGAVNAEEQEAPTAQEEQVAEPTTEDAASTEAAQVAEPTAQTAPIATSATETAATSAAVEEDTNSLLGQAMQLIRAQNERIAQLQEVARQSQTAVGQQSELAQNTIDSALAQPAAEIEIPVLNMQELQYQSPDEQKAALDAWQNAMVNAISDRVAAQYRAQIEPIKRNYEDNQRIAANEAAKAQLANSPYFKDFRTNEKAIEDFIASNPELASMDAGKRYALGALAVRGRNYDPDAKPTDEQIVDMVMNSPTAQKMLDTRRAQAIQQKNADIPTVMPSTGYSTAAAVPKPEVAKNKEELLDRIRHGLFGGNA